MITGTEFSIDVKVPIRDRLTANLKKAGIVR
jgi:hypothetical protein